MRWVGTAGFTLTPVSPGRYKEGWPSILRHDTRDGVPVCSTVSSGMAPEGVDRLGMGGTAWILDLKGHSSTLSYMQGKSGRWVCIIYHIAIQRGAFSADVLGTYYAPDHRPRSSSEGGGGGGTGRERWKGKERMTLAAYSTHSCVAQMVLCVLMALPSSSTCLSCCFAALLLDILAMVYGSVHTEAPK